MPETIYPPTLLCDFYKVSHKDQYPAGTTQVYSTWIPRESRVEGISSVVAFGFQAFIQQYLVDYFDLHFFGRPMEYVIAEYQRLIHFALGVGVSPESVNAEHIEKLWSLGYLPLRIKALPEGTLTPLRVPMLTIENTDPDFFWLTNYFETLFSAETWLASTSATIANEYRKLLDEWAATTCDNAFHVPFQGHDFSMRGMTSLESAAKSGAGHLLSFLGTDTIPAIQFAEHFYGADIANEMVGTSIPATEHSVMCAHGQDEMASYRHLLTNVYPGGFVSVVSDTWDLWGVLDKVIGGLKDEIMARDGRVVIRPDSGDPVDIICGLDTWRDGEWVQGDGNDLVWQDAPSVDPAQKGVIEILWNTFGGTVNEKGYRVLDPHIGAIYGDSITLERADQICERLAAKGFASSNIVFGIGSYTYQHVTRDTFGFALKSTWALVNGEERPIFKDPITDKDRMKKSLVGRVVVVGPTDELSVIDGLTLAEEVALSPENHLRTIFEDGVVTRFETFQEIRGRLQGTLVTRPLFVDPDVL